MRLTRRHLTKAALALLVVCVVSPATGRAQGVRTSSPGILDSSLGIFVSETPESRMQKWQASLGAFLDKSELSGEQANVLEELRSIDDPSYFADSLSPEQIALLGKKMAAVGQALPYTTYRELMNSLGGFRPWLSSNFLVAGPDPDPTPTPQQCNCRNDHDCATGFHCNHPGCLTAPGSLMSGVCS